METDWAENRAKIDEGVIRNLLGKVLDSISSTAERDKFRTRLERGTEPGTTEIYISHRGMEEVYINEAQEPDALAAASARSRSRSGNAAAPDGALRRAAGARQDRGCAGETAPVPRARRCIKGQAGGSMLSVNDQFDRAWRRVGLALDRVGFTVEDRDRSKGLYFVRYVDPDADNKSTQAKGVSCRSSIRSARATSRYRKSNSASRSRMRTRVSEVSVLNKDGVEEKSDTANRILSLLYEQLK